MQRTKITVLGAGNVGATIAYTLTVGAVVSEIVLIDINQDKSEGEAIDIIQGTPFSSPVKIYSGSYEDAAHSNIVIVSMGIGRKPGQSRLDLAEANVGILKETLPKVIKYAPDSVYLIVSNPVDILTYAAIRHCGLSERQVMGSGTMLDTSRLRTILGRKLHLNTRNIHAYVFGEHGDSAMIPWSQCTALGMRIDQNFHRITDLPSLSFEEEKKAIEEEVKTSGARIIADKGATYYAVSTVVSQMCQCILQDLYTALTVSGMINDRYGISDVCLSLPSSLEARDWAGPSTPSFCPKRWSCSRGALKF